MGLRHDQNQAVMIVAVIVIVLGVLAMYGLDRLYVDERTEYEQLTDLIDDYTRRLEDDPTDTWLYNSRGIARYELGEYAAAIADYNRALELDPDYANAHWGLGNVYYEMGDYPNAIAAYREYELITGRLEPIMQTRLAEMGG